MSDVEPARSLETTLQYQPLQTGGKRKKKGERERREQEMRKGR